MPEIVSSFADTAAPAPNLVATRVAASIRLRAEIRRGVRSGSTAPAELSLKAVAHGAALVESGVALEPSPCPLEWLAAARADLPMQAEGPTPGRAAVRVAAAFPLRSECHHKVPSD